MHRPGRGRRSGEEQERSAGEPAGLGDQVELVLAGVLDESLLVDVDDELEVDELSDEPDEDPPSEDEELDDDDEPLLDEPDRLSFL